MVHLALDMPHDPISAPLRNVLPQFLDRSDVVLKVADHDLGGTLSIKRMFAGKCIIKEAAESIHIGALVQRCTFKLLWGHEEN